MIGNPKEQYVSILTASKILEVSERTIRRYMKTDPEFPKPRIINLRRKVFLESELIEWMRSRPVEQRGSHD